MTPPRRQLGLGITAAIVVANMIGTGVFTSTGYQAHDLHDPMTILLAWVGFRDRGEGSEPTQAAS